MLRTSIASTIRHFLPGAAVALLFAAIAQAAPIEIKAMTRNLYFGADLSPLFGATNFSQIPGIVSGVIAAADATRPAERMASIVKEINDRQPHVVGLQEAALWQVFDPANAGLGFQPLFGGAFHQQLDAALPNYTLHAIAPNASNALPGADGKIYSLSDFDAILVRDGVSVLDSHVQQFAVALQLALPDSPFDLDTNPEILTLPRSFGYVDIQIDGLKTRVFNTHTEALLGIINHLQGVELAGAVNASPYLTIALGDFNTTTDIGTTGIYDSMTVLAGLTDAWTALNGPAGGFTWRNDPGLDMPLVDFTLRLDYVFHDEMFKTHSVEVFGNVSDGTAPLFPSDHAGVVATLQFVPAPGSLLLLIAGLAGLGVARRDKWVPRH